VDEVLDDETVTYPFTKQMCCVVTNGGGALVLTSRQRAASLARPPVYVLGSGESAESTMVPQMQDLGSFAGFRRASAEAFGTASVRPGTSTTCPGTSTT
jgi:acetyl-CoA acetyltransferase